MIQDELEEEYKNETGYSVGTINDIGTTYYSCDFVKWIINKLKKLRVADVSGSVCGICSKNLVYGAYPKKFCLNEQCSNYLKPQTAH